MNEHPEELLASYVERSLGADERAQVEAHLATCDRCREEVELATSAREALASLPELDAPRGIPFAVRRKARGAGAPSRTLRLAGAAAAAAVLVAGTIFVFGQMDTGTRQQAESGGAPATEAEGPAEDKLTKTSKGAPEAGGAAQEEAPALAAAPPPVLPIYEESDRDYESKDLAPLARRVRDDANAAVGAGIAPTARTFFSDFDPSAFTVEVRQAIRCVLTDVPPSQLIVPFRIEAASFQGSPAYVAAFLQGPTPDDAYDRIVIWVVHRETCDLISLASQVL